LREEYEAKLILRDSINTLNSELRLIRTNTTNSTAIGSGAKSVTTTGALASSTACRWVTVTNNSIGTVLYVGTTSVSSSNGIPLNYLDAITIKVDNLADVHVVSSGTTDARYVYGN